MLVYQLIEESLAEFQGKTAIIYEDQSITYEALKERVNLLSYVILKEAFSEEFIGMSATRSVDMIIGILAILKAGKAYLPLDPKYPSLRLEHLIADADLKYTLCPDNETAFFSEKGLKTIATDQHYQLQPIEPVTQSEVVCVLYTSGSTGKPKGVCLGHQGLINQIIWQKANGLAGPDVRTLQFSHISFDGAFLEIFVPLASGGTLYLLNDSYRYNIGNLLRFIDEHQINRLFLSYTVVQYLSETAQLNNFYPASVKEIITGGELLRITPQIANFFHHLPECILMNVYGPTEASVWVTELKLKGNALNWPEIPSLGFLVAGIKVYLVDETLQPVSAGETGEILIAGECNALYYLNKPEQTAERFIQWKHPVEGEIKVYRTGDLAVYNADGSLQFKGRRDSQVKIKGGYRVELGELEVVIGNIKGVSQVKVIVREDIPGERTIVAYLVVSDTAITDEHIKKAVANQLPLYMVPDAIHFLDEFPFTVSGKIDVLHLPAPQKIHHSKKQDYKEPENELESYLKALWEELLLIDNISTNESFFDLGGSSLAAIKMMIRIQKEKGKALPLVSVFDSPDIASLAKLIDNYDGASIFSALVAIKASGTKPPVYLIHGDSMNVLCFKALTAYIDPDQPVYGLQPRGIDGKLPPLGSIEEIAAYYLDAIKAHQPGGPYAIVGYSFGGYVAAEMVQQLKRNHKQVLLFGLLDTNAAVIENFMPLDKQLAIKIRRQVPKMIWILQSFMAQPRVVVKYQISTLWNRIGSFFNVQTKKAAPETEGYYNLIDQIKEVHHRALRNYTLKPYDDTIVLFKAMNRLYFVDDFKFLGWQKYTSKTVEVYEIPGDHATMFEEPHCRILAKKLDSALQHAANKIAETSGVGHSL